MERENIFYELESLQDVIQSKLGELQAAERRLNEKTARAVDIIKGRKENQADGSSD